MARRTGIHVARHRTVEDFEQAALDFLVAREPDHNLQLGVLAGLRSGRFDPGEAFLATLHGDDGAVVGVAMHTPPYPLGL